MHPDRQQLRHQGRRRCVRPYSVSAMSAVLAKMEAMQQTIVKIAMKLEEEGKLVLRKGSGDEFV